MMSTSEHTKTIYLVRHGKSDWGKAVTDKERSILPRAYKDAKLVCQEFKKHYKGKLHLISSTARRAFQTAELFKKELSNQVESFALDENLYTFNANDIKDYIQKLPDHWNHVMLFGHNPAFTEINSIFAEKSLVHTPTTGLIQLEFSQVERWNDTERAKRILELFPKDLRNTQ